jgi:hypothetical protein
MLGDMMIIKDNCDL